jgi:hypothetical protein
MRKVIQIAVSSANEQGEGEDVYALCDDGTIWLQFSAIKWIPLFPIPQTPVEENHV